MSFLCFPLESVLLSDTTALVQLKALLCGSFLMPDSLTSLFFLQKLFCKLSELFCSILYCSINLSLIVIVPPSLENFRAFDTKFRRICRYLLSSPKRFVNMFFWFIFTRLSESEISTSINSLFCSITILSLIFFSSAKYLITLSDLWTSMGRLK